MQMSDYGFPNHIQSVYAVFPSGISYSYKTARWSENDTLAAQECQIYDMPFGFLEIFRKGVYEDDDGEDRIPLFEGETVDAAIVRLFKEITGEDRGTVEIC